MGRIRFFQNGCSQSSRFPVPLDKGSDGSGNEIGFATRRTEAGFGWNAKGQSTSGVAPKRRRGPNRGIGVWTVIMETNIIVRPFV